MSDNMLPEEKLLQLIRRDKSSTSKRYSKKGSLFLRKIFGFRKSVRHLIARVGLLKITFFFLAISLLFLLVTFIYSPFTLDRRIRTSSYDIKIPTIFEEKKGEALQFYIQEVRRNDIFNITPAEKEEKGASLDGLKDIVLLGIISEEPPQAIMKDKKSGNTYFLKKGDTLGEFILLDILEGKIIIEYRGERFEIYL